MTQRHVRALALVLLSSAALSACGLKAEVKDQLSQGSLPGAGSGVDGTGNLGGATGATTGTSGTGTSGTSGSGTSGSGTSGTSGSGTSGTGTSGTSGPGTSGTSGTSGSGTSGSGGAPVQGGGTTTGIDFKNKVIKIALHGPLTGAGVPQQSFNSGPPKYWRDHKLANGFSVQARAIDDKYNAADALRACNAAADTDFLIIGGAGTDQIGACAQSPKLRRLNVPYLSSGVTEAGLSGINTYFATSLTYRQQAPLLIQLAKDKGYFGRKWAVVITGTPNFKDAREAFVDQLKKNGAKGSVGAFDPGRDVFLTDKAPSNCSALATQIRGGGYDAIYFLGQPSFFAQCVGAIGTSPVKPIYTGPGPSFGISSVITLACGASGNNYEGYFLHPSPSWNQRAKYGAPSDLVDDIELGIWGAMQQLEQAFNLVKGPLSRESFTQALAQGSVPGGVFAPTVFNGGSHFGGTKAYANAALCNGVSSLSNTIGVYSK